MPATSVRDLTIKDDDLVVATHGRGFWILDDIMPLRQITADIARASAYVFRPATAWRVRWNRNTDTPLPPDEPAAPNPPDGVVISYLLGPQTPGPVTLEFLETASGRILRRFSSDDPPDAPLPMANVADTWIRPPQRLSAAPGLHRFVWNLRFAPPAADEFEYPMTAVPRNTPKAPEGMWIMPGTYQIRLTAGGRVYRQAVAVRMDPRVKTPTADLALQFRLSQELDEAMRKIADARTTIERHRAGAAGDTATRLAASAASLADVHAGLTHLFSTVQGADVRPTAVTDAAIDDILQKAEAVLAAASEIE